MSEIGAPTPVIEARGLTVRLGAYEALRELTFRIDAGDYVILAGPNGAGKSTLVKCLLGLVPCTDGALNLWGEPPAQVWPGRIGYVPQAKLHDRLFPARAQDLVATGVLRRWPWRLTPAQRDLVMAALEQVGAAKLAARRIGELSGGELQRVYLARALVRQPQLILLDEPGTGMDVVGETDMHAILEHFQSETGATILMVTHDWQAEHYHANRVLLLNRRLVAFGPPEDVLTEAHLNVAFGHVGHVHKHVHIDGSPCSGGHTHD